MTATDQPIAALSEAIARGDLSPEALTDACLARIEAEDGTLGAFQAVYAEEARAAAEAAGRAIRAGHRIGPLHGIPFALKDIVEVEGRVTTWGSAALATRVSGETGLLARRLIAQGAVLLGKTRTVECAFGAWGTNRRMGTPMNPRDRQTHRIAGGSSSGSGVAVAAGMAVFAVGTDTGGSVRLPAAFCGIAGLKVTEGVLPLDGIMPLSHTLDTPGPMARCVADAALLFEAMRGAEPAALDRALGRGEAVPGMARGVAGLRLGVLDAAGREGAEAGVLALYDRAVAALVAAGAEAVPFSPPTPYDAFRDRVGAIIAAEAYAYHHALYDDPAQPMDEDVRARVLPGGRMSAPDYLAMITAMPGERARFLAAMAGLDALLTPSATVFAPPLAEVDQAVSPGLYTRPFNYLGMCGLSVPMGQGAEGLPAGLQVAARPHDEAMALRVGAALEAALAA